jgi:phosphatidylserine/phosphatidylglycerophosphate/cardiolipin synthase-like enzyme
MAIRGKRGYRFNWRDGNRFALLIDGDQFFPRMLDGIASARKFIWLEMYLFESGVVATRFIDTLLAAADRGVSIKLLLDDYGSRGLSRYERHRLQHTNVEVCFYNKLRWAKLFDNMARDHRKLLIVDGETAFVGGAGITDEFAPPDSKDRQWRETMLEVAGPALEDWQELFAEVWLQSRNNHIKESFVEPEVNPDGKKGRVTVASGIRGQGIMRSIVNRIGASERRVWLSTAYFVPSWKLRSALRRAARQGADVRLLLPGPETDHPAVRIAGHRYYTSLLKRGIRIFEFRPRMLHSKALICDQWVSIGSSNYDRWNFRWNLEANQEVDDEQFAGEVARMFTDDFVESKEIILEDWSRRPGYRIWRERFWGRVDHWLHRLGRGRRDH